MMDMFYIVQWRLFFSFLKKLKDLGKLCTAGRHHGLARSGSSAWTSRLLSCPQPLLCHRKPQPRCGAHRSKGEPFYIKPHWNHTKRLGLSVPLGSHYCWPIITTWLRETYRQCIWLQPQRGCSQWPWSDRQSWENLLRRKAEHHFNLVVNMWWVIRKRPRAPLTFFLFSFYRLWSAASVAWFAILL